MLCIVNAAGSFDTTPRFSLFGVSSSHFESWRKGAPVAFGGAGGFGSDEAHDDDRRIGLAIRNADGRRVSGANAEDRNRRVLELRVHGRRRSDRIRPPEIGQRRDTRIPQLPREASGSRGERVVIACLRDVVPQHFHRVTGVLREARCPLEARAVSARAAEDQADGTEHHERDRHRDDELDQCRSALSRRWTAAAGHRPCVAGAPSGIGNRAAARGAHLQTPSVAIWNVVE